MKPFFTHLRSLLLAVTLGLTANVSADNSAWMNRVSDNTFVSQLSIPGTHDSGTGHGLNNIYVIFSGDTYARTQDKTLTDQWNSGIRAFDLRPSVDSNRLRIYHGIISTNLYLDNALSTLCGLLDSHPTEFAIVIIRHEDDHDSGSSDWNGLMTSLLNSNPTKSHAVNYDPMAKMGDVRGKLLILSRDAYATTPVGGFITGWGFNPNFDNQKGGRITGNGTSGNLYVQDYYDVSASGASAKKTASIQRMLQFSCSENTDPGTWVINQTSGYSKTTSIANNKVSTSDGYRDNAATQNPVVIDYLNSHTGSAGMILMDFGGVDTSSGYNVKGQALTDALINNNFKTSPHADYFRALTTINAGAKYYVTTTYNGTKYFLTTTGTLTDDEAKAGVFTFSRVRGDAYAYGFNLVGAYFTNPGLNGNTAILNSGKINTNSESKRANWEAQVFYLNSSGKYAVRATNAASGESSWAVTAGTYWTVNSGNGGPVAEYSNSQNYIWNLETPSDEINVTYQVFFNGTQVGEVMKRCTRNAKSELPEEYRSDLCTYSYSPTKITAGTVKVTMRWKGPFTFSTDDAPHWYNLRIGRLGRYVGWENREPYHPHAFDDESAEVGKDPESDRAVNIESELYATELVRASDAYQWAFYGDPFNGIKVVNKLLGNDYALTIDGKAVTAYYKYHGRTDTAPKSVLRAGDGYAYGWMASKNTSNGHTDGFVLNMKGTNKFINPHGSADGYLQIWETVNAKDDENTQLRIEEVPAPEVSLAQVGDSYFTTLCMPYDVAVSGAEVYTFAEIINGKATFEEASAEVPAGTPVLLKGGADKATLAYGSGFVTEPGVATAFKGLFMPTATAGALTLQGIDDVLGFYAPTGDAIAPNSAYLASSDPSVTALPVSFGDEEDAIDNLNANLNANNGEIYNLAGQRMSRLQRGVNIVSGKKVMAK